MLGKWINNFISYFRMSCTSTSQWNVTQPHNIRLYHWNGNVVILMKFSSLAALKVVILTTFSAASDEDFIKTTTFSFQWCYWLDVRDTYQIWRRIKVCDKYLSEVRNVTNKEQQKIIEQSQIIVDSHIIIAPVRSESIPRFWTQRVALMDHAALDISYFFFVVICIIIS